MNYLLDTNVLIFLGCGHEERIPKKVLEIYSSRDSNIFISQISFWEIAIKINIGKLTIPIGLKNVINNTRQAGIDTIPVKNSHILYYQTLQLQENHKDPFDRFIIATALCENMKIISSDAKFDYYLKVDRIWEN
jgi:PIN domain nuclease of toxin-antitoxin system